MYRKILLLLVIVTIFLFSCSNKDKTGPIVKPSAGIDSEYKGRWIGKGQGLDGKKYVIREDGSLLNESETIDIPANNIKKIGDKKFKVYYKNFSTIDMVITFTSDKEATIEGKEIKLDNKEIIINGTITREVKGLPYKYAGTFIGDGTGLTGDKYIIKEDGSIRNDTKNIDIPASSITN